MVSCYYLHLVPVQLIERKGDKEKAEKSAKKFRKI